MSYAPFEPSSDLMKHQTHTIYAFCSHCIALCSYRYGADASRLTDNSLHTATNIGFTAYNMKHIGVKAIAKRTAKDTGKALMKDYETNPVNKNQTQPPPPSSSS